MAGALPDPPPRPAVRHLAMQLLTFTVAGQTYAVESRSVVEVLPLVPARAIPHTPTYVRGIFAYRGRLVPLVDLAQRLAGRAPAERLSTRVIVVEFVTPSGGPPLRLGLVAENVTTIRAASDATTETPALTVPDAPFLGRILRLPDGTVQLVDVAHLLPTDLAAGLCPASVPVPLP